MADLLPFVLRISEQTDLLLAFMNEQATLSDDPFDLRCLTWYIYDLSRILHDLESSLRKESSEHESNQE